MGILQHENAQGSQDPQGFRIPGGVRNPGIRNQGIRNPGPSGDPGDWGSGVAPICFMIYLMNQKKMGAIKEFRNRGHGLAAFDYLSHSEGD